MDFGEQKDPKADDIAHRGNLLLQVIQVLRSTGVDKNWISPETLRVAMATALDLAIGGNGTQGSLKMMCAFPPEGVEPGEAFLEFAAAINKPGAFDFLVETPLQAVEQPKDPQGALEALSAALPALAATGANVVAIDFAPNQSLFAVVTTDPDLISRLRAAVSENGSP